MLIIPTDGKDKILGRLHLHSKRHERIVEKTSSSKPYGQIQIDRIRGLVNIITDDEEMGFCQTRRS